MCWWQKWDEINEKRETRQREFLSLTSSFYHICTSNNNSSTNQIFDGGGDESLTFLQLDIFQFFFLFLYCKHFISLFSHFFCLTCFMCCLLRLCFANKTKWNELKKTWTSQLKVMLKNVFDLPIIFLYNFADFSFLTQFLSELEILAVVHESSPWTLKTRWLLLTASFMLKLWIFKNLNFSCPEELFQFNYEWASCGKKIIKYIRFFRIQKCPPAMNCQNE